MKLVGKNILVVGLGRTGLAAARFLHRQGAQVRVTDTASEKELGVAVNILRDLGVHLEMGSHRAASFQNADLIVVSPGVSHTIEPIVQANAAGVPVIGEVELASRFIKEPIIAVTGTNGKTTVTTLIGSILEAQGKKVCVCGNIGTPFCQEVEKIDKDTFVSLEISFLKLADDFRISMM